MGSGTDDDHAEEPLGTGAGKSAHGAGSTVLVSEFWFATFAGTPSTDAGKSAVGTGCRLFHA